MAEAAPPVPEPRLALVVALAGRSFWQAWDPRRTPPVDPTLRLALWLDEQPLAVYTDARTDPDDLPGALVNTFDFTAPAVAAGAVAPAEAEPPEVRPGRVTLRLRVPAALAGERLPAAGLPGQRRDGRGAGLARRRGDEPDAAAQGRGAGRDGAAAGPGAHGVLAQAHAQRRDVPADAGP